MATRVLVMACLVLAATMAPARAAVVRTTNFVVETARQDDAEEFARMAEQYRKSKAIEWLGREMPPWRQACYLRVNVTNGGAGGATTFDFNGTEVRQEMQIEGKRERLLNSVLPHEVTHTVFAHHFRQPVPRWADEGGSVYSEDDLERSRHDKLCVQILNAGQAIQLKALFRLKQYPRDVMTLYAQGFSVTKYLVERSDRQTFLNFVAAGLKDGWDAASKEYYQFRNVDELESAWIDHLHRVARGEAEVRGTSGTRRGPPPPAAGEGAKLVVFDSAPPSRPSFGPSPSSRGLSPTTSASEGASEIGWNRPRARDDVPAEPASRPRTGGLARPSPAAVLLPPEPAPIR